MIKIYIIGLLCTSVLIYTMISKQYETKFKIGDCVKQVYGNEFVSSIYYHKVVAIGKRYYLTHITDPSYRKLRNNYFNYTNEISKEDLNNFEKVDDKECP